MERLNQRLSLVANIAVVAGIVFLAIEVNQNTDSVRASAYQTWSDAKIALFDHSSESLSRTIAQGLDDPLSLTNDNYIQFAFWCQQYVLAAQTTYFLNKDGIIPDAVFEKEFEITVLLLSNSAGGSQWWAAGARTQFTEEFVNALEVEFGKPTNIQRWIFTEGRGFHPAE
jgi:hypothetical protein